MALVLGLSGALRLGLSAGTGTSGPPTLGTLSLSGSLVNGVVSTGTISGATAGSTITTTLAGLVINSAARTYTFNGGTASGASGNLVETLATASNSPNSTAVSVIAGVATVYYVDTARPNDTGDGLSPATAWKTVAKVLATTFASSSMILFKRAGTWNEEMALVSGQFGSVSKSILIGAYSTGAKPKFTPPTVANNGFFATNAQYIIMTDLQFVGQGITTNQGVGFGIQNDQGGNTTLKNITVNNVDVTGFGLAGILMFGSNQVTTCGFENLSINGGVVSNSGGLAPQWPYGNGVLVANAIYGVGSVTGSKNVNITGVEVFGCTGADGIVPWSGMGVTIADCTTGLIEGCYVHNNGDFGSANGGIMAYNSIGIIMQLNAVTNQKVKLGTTDGTGVSIDGASQLCVIQFNYTRDNAGAGIQVFNYSGGTAYRPMRDNMMRFNISENDANQNVSGKGSMYTGSSEALPCINNHFLCNTVYQSIVAGNGFHFGVNPDQFTGSKIANNIFYVSGTGGSALVKANNNNVPAYQMVGNLYFTNGQTVNIRWGATNYTSIAAWRAANVTQETISGADTSIASDPLFVGTVPMAYSGFISAGNFTPYKTQSGSPARNKGVDLYALFGVDPGPRDFFGNSIKQGSAFDIGAFEGV